MDAWDHEHDAELRLVDPARNRFRIYGLTECRTLFGELCLRVVWGRIGSRRLRERSEFFASRAELEARRAELLERRRLHGYSRVLCERHTNHVPASIERELVELHGLRLDDTRVQGLVARWYEATTELAHYLEAQALQREAFDLVDVSTLAAMYVSAA
jgi:predicted DNA-binding WGR domain protein